MFICPMQYFYNIFTYSTASQSTISQSTISQSTISQSTVSQSTISQSTISQSTVSQSTVLFCFVGLELFMWLTHSGMLLIPLKRKTTQQKI